MPERPLPRVPRRASAFAGAARHRRAAAAAVAARLRRTADAVLRAQAEIEAVGVAAPACGPLSPRHVPSPDAESMRLNGRATV